MQVHYTTKTFNYLISATCIAAIIVCYFELFVKNKNSESLSLFAIGQITKTTNTVKRKSEDFLGWQEVDDNAPISPNNLVFTHKDSTAQIKVDTSSIALGPETMIEVVTKDSISINQGKMDITFSTQSKPLKVSSGGTNYLLQSSGAKVSINKENSVSTVMVHEGELNLKNLNSSKSVVITKDQSLKISRTQHEVYSSKIDLDRPKEGDIFESTKPIQFKVETKLQDLKLQISKDKDFINLDKVIGIQGTKKLKVDAGNYYWRINAKNVNSEKRAFKVINIIQPPKLLTPRVHFEKVYYTDSTQLYFSWKKNKHKAWLLEIFDMRENLVFFKEVTSPNYLHTTQREGHFKWSVTPIAPFSEIRKQVFYDYSLIKEPLKNIKSIVLELKKPNQKVNFSWQSQKNQISVFELSDDKNFSTLITTKKLRSNKTSVVFPKIGTYYWRSFTVNSSGKKLYNLPIRLTIKPIPKPQKPKPLPSLKLKLKTQTPSFSFHLFNQAYANNSGEVLLKWPKVENAKIYEIEIYTDKKLKRKIKTISTTQNNFKWKAPRAGQFYWRYRVKDYWGRYSPYSDRSVLELIQDKRFTKSQKKISKPKSISNQSKLDFSYLLTTVDYTNSNNNDFVIDGIATNGFKAGYQFRKFKLSLSTITGEVFDDQKFFHRSMELGYIKKFEDIFFETGITSFFTSIFRNKNSKAVSDGVVANYLIFSSANLYWHQNKLKSTLKLGLGTAYLLNLSSSYYFYSVNAFKFFIKAHGELFRAQDDDQEIKSQQFQASIGSSYSF